MATRTSVLTCRKCRKQTSADGRDRDGPDAYAPDNVFWGAYLVSTVTPGISAVQFQRQLGLTVYETAFASCTSCAPAWSAKAATGSAANLGRGDHVEIDETWIGGKTRGRRPGHSRYDLVRRPSKSARARPRKATSRSGRGGRYAGRLRLEIVPTRGAKSLGGFVERR